MQESPNAACSALRSESNDQTASQKSLSPSLAVMGSLYVGIPSNDRAGPCTPPSTTSCGKMPSCDAPALNKGVVRLALSSANMHQGSQEPTLHGINLGGIRIGGRPPGPSEVRNRAHARSQELVLQFFRCTEQSSSVVGREGTAHCCKHTLTQLPMPPLSSGRCPIRFGERISSTPQGQRSV